MIKFFRKIRQRLLTENKFSKYLIYASGEIILVVIGILIALQINNKNELRKENETAKTLAYSLVQDLQKDVDFLKANVDFSKKKLENCSHLLKSLSKPVDELDNSEFYKNISSISQSNPFFPTNGTYEQIKASGTLKYFEQEIVDKLNAYDMHTNKTLYWTDTEDKTLWLMAKILWTGVNVQALGEIRFDLPQKQEIYIRIKDEDIDEFSNYVATIKIYRQKILTEYDQQLNMANELINTFKTEYELD